LEDKLMQEPTTPTDNAATEIDATAPVTTTDTTTPVDNSATVTEPTPEQTVPVVEGAPVTSVADTTPAESTSPDVQIHPTHVSAYEADIDDKITQATVALQDVRDAVQNYKTAVANNLVTTVS
jgi:hypothetical protein